MQKENKKITKNISVEMLQCNISTRSKGFTLVELIITITVIAILFTIAYVSFKNYVKDARDGTRVSSI
jgi:prepilin-type N-terminal cleavage/methylation domain-containing protein